MNKKLQILDAIAPLSHHHEEQYIFELIRERVFEKLDSLGLFHKLLPVIEKIDADDFKDMQEMDRIFQTLKDYTVEIRKIISEEKVNMEKQMQEASGEVDLITEEESRKVSSPLILKGKAPMS